MAGLLGNHCDAAAHLPQMRRHSQEQWAGTSDNDALAGDRESSARQRLQAARTEDAGQRPAGEREKAFTRAGRQDQMLVGDVGSVNVTAIVTDSAQSLRARRIEDAPAGEDAGAGDTE